MKLTKILEGLMIKESRNNLDLDITNIHSDSRKIKENGLFVAIDGYLQIIPNSLTQLFLE